MKTALYLVLVIAALACAGDVVEDTQKTEAANTDAEKITPPNVGGGLPRVIQQAVAGDLGLKLVTMEDGTPSGKCYCSCNLNSQPVFMEFDHLPANYALE